MIFSYNFIRLYSLGSVAQSNDLLNNKYVYLVLSIICWILGSIHLFRSKSESLRGSYGSLPSGLDEEITCSVCGRTYYTLDNPTMEEKLKILNDFDWDCVNYHRECGRYTCARCMGIIPFCRCGGGGTIIQIPVARRK